MPSSSRPLSSQRIRCTNLDDLPAFAVAFGDHNATVRMEPNRDDLFDRIDLGRDWPVPGLPGARSVRAGRRPHDRPDRLRPCRDPRQAAALTLLEELPFAVCNEVTPIAEPTGL